MNHGQLPNEEPEDRNGQAAEQPTEASIEEIAAQLAEQDGEEAENNAQVEGEEAQDPEEFDLDDEAAVKRAYKVNGKRLTGEELRKSLMFEADYRQKTAATAELRRKVEAKEQALEKELGTRVNQIDVLVQALHTELVGETKDLSRLINENPVEYLRRKDAVDRKSAMLNQALQQKNALEQQQQYVANQKRGEYLREQEALLMEKLPAWRDPARKQAEQTEIARYLVNELGYTPEEISGLDDHRALITLRKAMLFDKAQKMRGQTKPLPRPAIKAGSAQPQAKRIDPAVEKRLRNSGKLDDIAALIEMKGL
jgi:hypothetical protein